MTAVFTTLIVAYPVAIFVMLGLNQPKFQGNVVIQWELYEVFYMFNFIFISILLVTSTMFSLRHMRLVFGDQSVAEEKSIRCMLVLFCCTYAVRVVITVLMFVFRDGVEHLFAHDFTTWLASVLVLWIIWDAVPMLSMLSIHYKNFSSFVSEDILYTEYSVDDVHSNDFPFDRPSMDLIPQNLLETSGVINLDSDDDSQSEEEEEEEEEEEAEQGSSRYFKKSSKQKSIMNKSQRSQTTHIKKHKIIEKTYTSQKFVS